MSARDCKGDLLAAAALTVTLCGSAWAQWPASDMASIEKLRARALAIPVQAVQATHLTDTYLQSRGAGTRSHEALDIPAPLGTPVIAAGEGRIIKLFLSKPGGITVYQFDPDSEFAYYYAHLDRYADGLKEGAAVQRGDIIGYVGSSGNAVSAVPHLHFAIFRLGPQREWWRGTPLNPFDIWRGAVR